MKRISRYLILALAVLSLTMTTGCRRRVDDNESSSMESTGDMNGTNGTDGRDDTETDDRTEYGTDDTGRGDDATNGRVRVRQRRQVDG